VIESSILHAVTFNVQQATVAVILADDVSRLMAAFFLLDVIANCSASSQSLQPPTTLINTHVTALCRHHLYYTNCPQTARQVQIVEKKDNSRYSKMLIKM